MICGVTAEFNPFHNGHEYLLSRLRASGADTVVAAMSGNFVQRGEPAICDKLTRAKAAVGCGADLVIELPTSFALSGAERFARGAVTILSAIGCDSIGFGCECGDINKLTALCDYMQTAEYTERLTAGLNDGLSYPSAAYKAADVYSNLLNGANNTLAIEYITAARKLIENCGFVAVRRVGAEHDSDRPADGFASATLLRSMLKSGGEARKYMPENAEKLFSQAVCAGIAPADYSRLEAAALARLRTMTKAEIAALPDVSEGLENRIIKAAQTAVSLEQLFALVKSKRFTHARIRRIVLCALLGFDKSVYELPIPYIRPLAFNDRGQKLLKTAAASSPLPVYTKSAAIYADENCRAFFEAERRASSVYALALPDPAALPDELRLSPVKMP